MNKELLRFVWLISFLLVCPVNNKLSAQVSLSGLIADKISKTPLPYTNIVLKHSSDSSFVGGCISNEEGRFTLNNIGPKEYLLVVSSVGYEVYFEKIVVGSLSPYLDLGRIELQPQQQTLSTVDITAKADEVSGRMDKKTFNVSENTTQAGSSVLQVMKNLPGVTVNQDGKVNIRGSDKVLVLLDGKQTAITGFDNQSSLDNIPASAIEKIEVINNPSAKHDANGNAGIINIVYKKNNQEGFNGKMGMTAGLGALWMKKENLPGIRPQFRNTPKLNPSLSLNYKKKKVNLFFQSDFLYTQTLNKNEFVTRNYDTLIIHQQTKRNRTTTFSNTKLGADFHFNENNSFTLSTYYGYEKIIDRGDEPFYNSAYTELRRLWQFLEDEAKITLTASGAYLHKFKQAGHQLNFSYNYTFHREDEKYFFTNFMPTYTGFDAYKLLSDEHVSDFTLDYSKPLKKGRFETGAKFRNRNIPTNMKFIPGYLSPLDTNAGGWANYKETIPALYGIYVYENKNLELEAGLRYEYVNVDYQVNPGHSTYKSDGYEYMQPFPNLRLSYKINSGNKLSFFYNRRVDRPAEVDIRVFPKYDDAEILKTGNPALNPQYTNRFEIGYKCNYSKGYLYSALFHKMTEGTITRIGTVMPGTTLIYSIMQNAGKSYASGIEFNLHTTIHTRFNFTLSTLVYNNVIEAFSIVNKYPQTHTFTAEREQMLSGNAKLISNYRLAKTWDLQLSFMYLAPDIFPQGKTGTRYSLDAGLKKMIHKGKGEFILNATDLLNTMLVQKEIKGAGFNYASYDYFETQVIRAGYFYKF